MSTILGLSASNIYSYLSAMNAGNSASVNPANTAALVQAAQLSAITTLTGGNSASPLTYNASGLPGTLQPPAAITSNTAATPAEAAQNAYLQVEYAISQTLGSMISGASSDASNSDLSSLFGLTAPAGINSLPGSTSTTGTSAQAAQYAAINAQFALTEALNSMTSNTFSSVA